MKKTPIQITFSFFIFFILLLSLERKMAMAKNTISINIGVILDMETWVGKMGLSSIQMAISDFYASRGHYKSRLVLHNHDSKLDVVNAAAAALDLLKYDEVQAILGPQSSMQADFITALGDKAQVPIISFSATSPSLSSIRSPYFIRTTPIDSSQVKAISAIVQTFGWRQVVPIYVDNGFGEGIIPSLADALDEINCRIPYRSVIPSLATDDQIVSELYKLMTMQTRVFIVHMAPSLGSRLFTKAKQIGMLTEGYVWIITDGLTNGLEHMDPLVAELMSGVIGITPYIPPSKELESFAIRWKKQFQLDNPTIINPQLNAYALWAYDSAMLIAMAVEKAGAVNSGFRKSISSGNTTDLETFGLSRNGPKLLQALLETKFRGLSGEFRIVNGQLESPSYQIVNVINNGTKVIGFWTRENGIVEKLESVLWPGQTTSVPKGWVFPTNGKKLRVGVPTKHSFTEFVKVTRHFPTNTTKVEGYCIDVFEAVIANLPYSVTYEYIPHEISDGKTPGSSYNDLVYQVYEGKYDVVVGDVTIVANRSNYVDFTLPYTESGVMMVVPIQSNTSNKAWLFLKPLTWQLWVISFCYFVFVGFIVWVLEHRINEEFRGPALYQIGLIFWFGFSTMVFAHKERVVSNLARFVLIIWFLVVLILTQSYTASLTSMLTIQNLQPSVRDIDVLLKSNIRVGYKAGSFVCELLRRMEFDESRLVEYKSPEECDQLLSKGSEDGGIGAAFFEIPYMKLFLARYCSKYTMVEPTYKTDGFGFVFPIGSPLVADVSRSILNVTQGKTMVRIEKAWLGDKDNCKDSKTSPSYKSLGLDSFWGLFLIVGIASILAFLVCVMRFMHNNSVFTEIDRDSSPWRKIKVLAIRFYSRDLTSHTFRESAKNKSTNMDNHAGEGIDVVELTSPCSNCRQLPQMLFPPSPSCSSNTENYLASPREEGNQNENFNSHQPR